MSRYKALFIALAIAFGLVGTIAARTQEAKEKPSSGKNEQEAKDTAGAADPYIIGPMDVLNIDVWQEKELSGQVPVRPDGKISLPLVNDVQASGLTATQLASVITERLTKYVHDPRVTVVVAQVNSRRIYVLGEVAHQGAFTLMPNMTVLEALSEAGGLTPFAHQAKIYIMRKGQSKHFPFNYKNVVKGKNSEENIELQPGDTIFVP